MPDTHQLTIMVDSDTHDLLYRELERLRRLEARGHTLKSLCREAIWQAFGDDSINTDYQFLYDAIDRSTDPEWLYSFFQRSANCQMLVEFLLEYRPTKGEINGLTLLSPTRGVTLQGIRDHYVNQEWEENNG